MKNLVIDDITVEKLNKELENINNFITKKLLFLETLLETKLFNVKNTKSLKDEEKVNDNLEHLLDISSEYIIENIISKIFIIEKFLITNYMYYKINEKLPVELENIINVFKVIIIQINNMLDILYFAFKVKKHIFKEVLKNNFNPKEVSYYKKFINDYYLEISFLNKIRPDIKIHLEELGTKMTFLLV